MKTKLYRNLKPGDTLTVETGWGIRPYRHAVVTVSKVYETRRCWFTNRKQWAVCGDYPWWFGGPIHAYSDERVELCH